MPVRGIFLSLGIAQVGIKRKQAVPANHLCQRVEEPEQLGVRLLAVRGAFEKLEQAACALEAWCNGEDQASGEFSKVVI